MPSFQTVQDGRFFTHVLPTNQFRSRFISIKLDVPLTREGLTGTALLPYLWMEGSTHYPDAKSLTRKAEDMFGTHLYSNVGKRGDRQVAELTASFPSSEVVGMSDGASRSDLTPDVYDVMLEVVMEPLTDQGGFPLVSVEREKRLHKHRIESLLDDKIAYALERCLTEVANDSPAGLPRLGYIEDLAGLTPTQLWSMHQDLLRKANIHVYYVGSVSDAGQMVEFLLSKLKQRLAGLHLLETRTFANPGVEPLSRRGQAVRTVVDSQDVGQGKLNLGLRTGVSYSSPSYMPLLVANGILGGFPHSKLFQHVRERESLAYYASSRLDGLTGVVAVQTGIEIANYDRALKIILEQVEKLRQGDISQEEMELTRRQLQNQYTQALDLPVSLLEVHYSGQLAGIHRGVEDLLEQVSQVTLPEVITAAQTLETDVIYFLRNQEGTQHG